jgi:DNA-binding IclR family transcriptional regulator
LVEYHCTAVGKVFLAYGRAPLPTAALSRYTQHTITDPDLLRTELEAVRGRGWATAIDELEEGLAAIAAPVTGARGDVVAALSVSGPSLRMTPQRNDELHPLLIEQARALSRRLHKPDQGEHAA